MSTTPDIVEVIVEGPPGPAGESPIMGARTFWGNASGTTAYPDDYTAAQMGVVSATESQTWTDPQKTQALSNIGAQPVNAGLTAISALTTQSYGRSFLTLADAAAGRSLLALAAIAASGSASDLTSGELPNARLSAQVVRNDLTYANPAWITELVSTKITGTLTKLQQHAQTAYYDAAGTFTLAQTFANTVKISKGDANADSYSTRVDSLVFSRGDLPTSYLNKITNSFSATPGNTTMNFELGDGSGSGYVVPLTLLGSGVVSAATEFRLAGNSYSRVAQKDASGGWGGGYNFNLNSDVSSRDSTGAVSAIRFLVDGSVHLFAESSGSPGGISPRYTFGPTGATFNGQAFFSQGLRATGTYPHGSIGEPGVISYEYPYTRNFAGDGSGYTWAVSKRTGGVTTDIFTIYDASGDVNIKGNSVHIQGAAGGWGSQFAFKGSSGTNRGGFGAVGTSDTLDYYWIGPSYSLPHVKISSSGLQVNSTGVNPASLVLSTLDYPTAYTRINYDPNLADTQFTINYEGSSVYGGWKFQNLVGSTVTTKAEIKGNGDFAANGDLFAKSLNADVGSNKNLKSYRDGSVAGFYTGASVSAEAAWYMTASEHYFTIGGSTKFNVLSAGTYTTGEHTVTGAVNFGSPINACRAFQDSGNLYLESDGTIFLRDTSTSIPLWYVVNDGRTFSKTNVWHTDSDGSARILYNGSGGATNFNGAYNFVSSDRGHGMKADGSIVWGSPAQTGNNRGTLTWDTDKAIVTSPLNMDIISGGAMQITAPSGVLIAAPTLFYGAITSIGDTNGTHSLVNRNENSGSSAVSRLVLNAYGNSWGIGMGSTANNSNALEIREDALGANTLRFKMDIGGAATFNGNVRSVSGGGSWSELRWSGLTSSGTTYIDSGAGSGIQLRTDGANVTALEIASTGAATFNGTVTSTFSSSTSDLSTLDLTDGQTRLHKNTVSGNLKLFANDAGTIRSVTLV